MKFEAGVYFADQDLLSASVEVGPFNGDGYDEWLKLRCANNAVGWLLISDIDDATGFGAPNIVEYGRAEDLGSPQPVSQRTFWSHNGSTMYLVVDGHRRQFFYQQPKPGMLQAGARPNSLLFDGEVVDNAYSGTAYIFNKQCGQFPYSVNGPILYQGRRVEMHGRAPRVDGHCRISGYRNDVLEFRLVQ
jgi:hypothetical protein